MPLYIYKGPVLEFGKCIENNWYGKTKAESSARAKNNLAFQYKKKTGRLPRTKIDLPGTLILEGETNG